jgi:hypothetical protein
MKRILFSLLLVACSSADPGVLDRGNDPTPSGEGTGEAPPANPPAPQCASRDYKTFDGSSLANNRVKSAAGVDRGRVKPYESLASEYARVLGATPASLAGAAQTFAQPPKRWFEEPQGNAVAISTAYTIAFDGCIDYTASDAAFATTSNAPATCAKMQRAFWSKTPTPAEIQACADVAVTGAASEPAPRRKWAYACASVLTAAGFMTY